MKKYLLAVVLCVFAACAFVVVGLCMGIDFPTLLAQICSALFFSVVGALCLLAFVSKLNDEQREG